MTEECGLLNLAVCLPQKIYEFILNILNAPIKPLLELTKNLLIEPINLESVAPIWAIILYILSLFYGLLLAYSGFNFIISGYDIIKRAKAKSWFQNIFIMIVLIQSSYFIYALFIDISSLLTAGIINLIDENFFLLTADNNSNVGIQFFFALFYILTILLTVLLLSLRYLLVLSGLIFFPLAIFLYFIPPVQDYGKTIFNLLGSYLFITFFDALILLVCSQVLEIPLFADYKILVMFSSFSIVNFLMIYLILFSVIKSAINSLGGIGKTVTTVVKYLS